jgi:hypothetical protein
MQKLKPFVTSKGFLRCPSRSRVGRNSVGPALLTWADHKDLRLSDPLGLLARERVESFAPGSAVAFAFDEDPLAREQETTQQSGIRGGITGEDTRPDTLVRFYRKTKAGQVNYREEAYLLCDDNNLSAKKLLQAYFDRWQIEINHRDEKSILGVGQAQVGRI